MYTNFTLKSTWSQKRKEEPSHENTCMRQNNNLILFHYEIQNCIYILQTPTRVWTKVIFRSLR
jgi:hypothetical protein